MYIRRSTHEQLPAVPHIGDCKVAVATQPPPKFVSYVAVIKAQLPRAAAYLTHSSGR